MTFYDWVQNSKDRISQEGITGLETVLYELYVGVWRRANKIYSIDGRHVYDQEWDVLIILDACRADLFKQIETEYSFITDSESVNSIAPNSIGWMKNTFTREYSEEVKSTAYISGNGFSDKYLDSSNFKDLDVVSNYVWDDDLQTIPPRPITDRGIKYHRENSPERMILHYMQPHIPFIRRCEDGYEKIFQEVDGVRKNKYQDHSVDVYEFDLLRRGQLNFEEFWAAYKENLRAVLDDVQILLTNIDAEKVVITADHANAVGEYGIYGHDTVPISAIRKVPWCETTATDKGQYTPKLERQDTTTVSIEDRLEDLGYM